jgi:cytochrome P450
MLPHLTPLAVGPPPRVLYNKADRTCSDLAFGESFHSLETLELHHFVQNIYNNFKVMPIVRTMHYFGLLRYLPYLLPSALKRSQAEIAEIGGDKLTRRIAKGVAVERKDFMTFILQKYDPKKDRHVLENLTTILLVGGSETTATLLSGLTYYLLTNSRVYEKLKHEIRSSFSVESEITLTRASGLPYMKAVIDEALRIYPPTPISFPRIVPGTGEIIQGRFVPGGVCCFLDQ